MQTEIGTIEHEGRSFSALGAHQSEDGARMVAYVSSDGRSLTDWHGTVLAPLTRTGRAAGFHGVELICYRCEFEGRTWFGRGLGPGMCLKLRAKVA